MKRLSAMSKRPMIAISAIALLTLSAQPVLAGGKHHKNHFPNIVPTLDYALPEGFTIGRRTDAYNGSIDGSIYKVDLRTGSGDVLVPPDDPFVGCTKLGIRWDSRTNYLFVAGCEAGNLQVIDADTGELIMDYPLPLPAGIAESEDTYQIVNDLVITRYAVFVTDSHQPVIYKVPLGRRGELPDADDLSAIELTGEFVNIAPEEGCCGANGIEAAPDGKTLIVGHSNYSQLFRVDPNTGYSTEIVIDEPLIGFLDGIVLRGNALYVLTPFPFDMVQVVELDMPRHGRNRTYTGKFLGLIIDENMDGVASGAFFGSSLYVNNAHYSAGPEDFETWVTKLNSREIQSLDD